MALKYPEKYIGTIRFGVEILSVKKDLYGKFTFTCKCICGKIYNLKSPYFNKKRAGCAHCSSLLWRKNSKTHGLTSHPLSKVWRSIISRCENAKDRSYKHYGGRGISVCNEWKDICVFVEWGVKNGYQKGLSIDRINVNGNYEPSNYRWATKLIQNNNTRSNIFFEINGESLTMGDWARRYGKTRAQVSSRFRKGWSIEAAVKTPMNKKNGNPGNYR